MKEFVTQRLEALLQRPDGWGPPLAVELQFLLLVEMWHVVQGASTEHVDGVAGRFERFLRTRFPGGPPVPLALRLGLDQRATDEFIDVLKSFLEQEQAGS